MRSLRRTRGTGRKRRSRDRSTGNKRRKKLEYGLIEGWGELPQQQGEEKEELQHTAPLADPNTREQEQRTGEPPRSLQQRRELNSPSELGSPIPGEQSLRQPRISEFLNPAPLEGKPLDRPTLLNQGASLGSDLTATRKSGCRSPCTEERPDIHRAECKDKRDRQKE